jgi:hypothetical protein
MTVLLLMTALLAAGSGQKGDAFWCPMHPDMRSSTAGKCPVCAMDLVAIPPATLGNYRLNVTQVSRDDGRGVRALHIDVRNPATANVVHAFSPLHERLLHLFVVGRDLSYFDHVHPVPASQGFDVAVDLEPGAYVLIADFAPVGGAPQLVHRAIVTPGFTGSPFTPVTVRPDMADKIVDGVRIGLQAQTRVLKPSLLRFSVRDAATGAPVDDLEPFLGASGHLLIVNADVTTALHAHPESGDSPTAIGPEVAFAPTFGNAGAYKMWVQFQRGGRVITAPFAVEVQ